MQYPGMCTSVFMFNARHSRPRYPEVYAAGDLDVMTHTDSDRYYKREFEMVMEHRRIITASRNADRLQAFINERCEFARQMEVVSGHTGRHVVQHADA